MNLKGFISHLKLNNFLSYGPDFLAFGNSEKPIQLGRLNVLIGPNASGKSNLIEAIKILKATPTDLARAIRASGGITDILWKGETNTPTAQIEAVIDYPAGQTLLAYKLDFTALNQKLDLVDEVIYKVGKPQTSNLIETDFYYKYQQGNPVINVYVGEQEGVTKRTLRREDILPNQSILSQIKDSQLYPEITYIANQFAKIRIYRRWDFPGDKPPKMPQRTDEPGDFLAEDCSNLALVLNNLQHQMGGTRQFIEQFVDRLKKVYEQASDISTQIFGGTIQVFLNEEGLSQPIPATRLSDGTLRYLCLMAILCHPNPPPLICIEEPEIGLHPDMMPTIAEMLIEASQKTQLIVTTHSDALVAALPPESIIVCERDNRGTRLNRLNPENLKEWLKEFSLGALWRMGEIGGNRW